jgi:hypothetical protein
MKDIDFDELDRAVNSLIGPNSTSSAAKPAVVTATPAPVSVPVVPAPAGPLPTLNPADQLHAAPVAPPLAQRRSSGRFMDVVHPSSDMRTSPVPPRPTVHTEMTITPPSSATLAPEPAMEPKEPVVVSPDLIDVPTPLTEEVEDAPSPLESPFLSDAKVEKRPLGAFSTETPTPVPVPVTPQPEAPKPEIVEEAADKTDHPMEKDTPLPAELQDNLLSIEANEDTASKKDATPDPIPTIAFPTAATSIPTQYAEQPSTGDQPTGAVFNTEAYKKPMAHPKKKSGWLVVLWIFLLLIVGAGVGAAIYFFVLPKL